MAIQWLSPCPFVQHAVLLIAVDDTLCITSLSNVNLLQLQIEQKQVKQIVSNCKDKGGTTGTCLSNRGTVDKIESEAI